MSPNLCWEILLGHVTDTRNIVIDAQPPIDGWAACFARRLMWHTTLKKLVRISLKEDGKKPKGVVQPPISAAPIQSIDSNNPWGFAWEPKWSVVLPEVLSLCPDGAEVVWQHEADLHNIRQVAHQQVQMRTELLAPLWKLHFKFHKKVFPKCC